MMAMARVAAAFLGALACLSGPAARAQPASSPAGLEAILAFSFVSELTRSERGDTIAWVARREGVRNIWVASGPGLKPRQVTTISEDDGQELTGLSLSPDGSRLVWVRGGDHDSNWEAEGNLQPNPASGTEQPVLTIWTARSDGGAPVKVAEGDAPSLSSTGRLAFIRDGQAWTASPDGSFKPERLFFDRGKIGSLTWSPDGSRLAFVSNRGDHAFVGLFSAKDRPILWLAPSSGRDSNPVWSPDGTRIAFTRRMGIGGAPEPRLVETPQPWSIWVADASSGEAKAAWRSDRTLEGGWPRIPDGPNLDWAAGDRLVFRAEMDGWPHLYSVAAAGGSPILLTPGAYMVEHVALSADRASLLYSANAGKMAGDDDRRHIFRVPVDRAAPVPLTSGEGLEWTPVSAGTGIAFIAATAARPPALHWIGTGGERAIAEGAAYAPGPMVVPKPVTFRAADGLLIHGQLFEAAGGKARKPGLIFVHGGPPRQMLLGWSYMFYYAHAYAMNQYLASRGFVVLSVNYRLGIGYGRAFQHPKDAGPAGASEYRDVIAGAHFLQ
ncbi:MAG: peptidase prolyl oligopeptidase active site protein, partial [Alphaproteobacteria bacterium]|nr:peptidase prolyl oligopeptidase active site protein [Alphaproteobacteria bacterium]